MAKARKEEAIGFLRRSADAEDVLGKHPVSPGALVPIREQLGDLMLEMNRPKDAQREFEAALKIYPGRFRGLYGAALAAEQTGDKESGEPVLREAGRANGEMLMAPAVSWSAFANIVPPKLARRRDRHVRSPVRTETATERRIHSVDGSVCCSRLAAVEAQFVI